MILALTYTYIHISSIHVLTDQVRIFTNFVMSIKRTNKAHAKMNYFFLRLEMHIHIIVCTCGGVNITWIWGLSHRRRPWAGTSSQHYWFSGKWLGIYNYNSSVRPKKTSNKILPLPPQIQLLSLHNEGTNPSASNGGLPTRNSYVSTPRLHTSAVLSCSRASTISGGR